MYRGSSFHTTPMAVESIAHGPQTLQVHDISTVHSISGGSPAVRVVADPEQVSASLPERIFSSVKTMAKDALEDGVDVTRDELHLDEIAGAATSTVDALNAGAKILTGHSSTMLKSAKKKIQQTLDLMNFKKTKQPMTLQDVARNVRSKYTGLGYGKRSRGETSAIVGRHNKAARLASQSRMPPQGRVLRTPGLPGSRRAMLNNTLGRRYIQSK